MSQSPAIAATMDGELVNPEGTQVGKNTRYLAAIRLQPLPMVSTQETQDLETEYWPQIAEVPIKGMNLVIPDSCIFPYIEKC